MKETGASISLRVLKLEPLGFREILKSSDKKLFVFTLL